MKHGNTILPVGWPKYRRGYMGRDYHVTGEHEAEAQAAQRKKKPSRLGRIVLWLLGFRGHLSQPDPLEPVSPRHERVHDES